MTPSKKSDEEQQKFIDYRFNEVDKKLSRIEAKMDSFQFAKQSEVDKLAAVATTVENRLTILEQSAKTNGKISFFLFTIVVGSGLSFTVWLIERFISK